LLKSQNNKPNTKSTIIAAAKFAVELNQSTDNSSKKEGIQQVKAKL
jgi:hypothetical protein